MRFVMEAMVKSVIEIGRVQPEYSEQSCQSRQLHMDDNGEVKLYLLSDLHNGTRISVSYNNTSYYCTVVCALVQGYSSQKWLEEVCLMWSLLMPAALFM